MARADNFEIPTEEEVAPFTLGGILNFAVSERHTFWATQTCGRCGQTFLRQLSDHIDIELELDEELAWLCEGCVKGRTGRE